MVVVFGDTMDSRGLDCCNLGHVIAPHLLQPACCRLSEPHATILKEEVDAPYTPPRLGDFRTSPSLVPSPRLDKQPCVAIFETEDLTFGREQYSQQGRKTRTLVFPLTAARDHQPRSFK